MAASEQTSHMGKKISTPVRQRADPAGNTKVATTRTMATTGTAASYLRPRAEVVHNHMSENGRGRFSPVPVCVSVCLKRMWPGVTMKRNPNSSTRQTFRRDIDRLTL